MVPCRTSAALLVPLLLVAATLAGCGRPAEGDNAAPRQTSPPAVAIATPPAANTPRPPLRPGARTRVLEAAGDREFDRTFDDLRFDIGVGDVFRRAMLPATINAMDGKPIRIRGFILPTPQKRGIKQFVLVRDNQECCFGPGAALFDCILVEMNADRSAEFTIRPVAVTGTFRVEEFLGPDGKHLAIYRIAGESVK